MTPAPALTEATCAKINLTDSRLRILETAANDKLGLVERPYMTGFERVSWNRNADALVKAGLLKPYVHGGFEITEQGRLALHSPKDNSNG